MGQKILIIGTDETYISFIKSKTGDLDIELHSIETIDKVTEHLNKGETDVVFISDETIDGSFPETIQILKATTSSPAIPVFFYLTRYICFDSWDGLLIFMIHGLELDVPETVEILDSS